MSVELGKSVSCPAKGATEVWRVLNVKVGIYGGGLVFTIVGVEKY